METWFQRTCAICIFGAFALATASSPAIVAPQPSAIQLLDALRSADIRVGRIGYRLATANAASCENAAPATSLIVQSLAQYATSYREQAKTVFGFEAPMAVEAVLDDGAMEVAAVQAGDSITSLNGHVLGRGLPDGKDAPNNLTVVEYYHLLWASGIGRPLNLGIIRNGREQQVLVATRAACRSRFEVLLGRGYVADADGETVRIGAGFLARLDDDQLAVIVAHELAHNILGHRAESDGLKIRGGIAAEFGRSASDLLRMEDEADCLSVALLKRAGYDPALAAEFWRGEGRKIQGVLPRSPSHRGWRTRAALLDRAASDLTR